MITPNIVYQMFEDFRCLEIDGVERLHADYEITCWDTVHLTYSYAIAIPTLIVWGLLAPFGVFASLSKIYRDK